QYVNSQAETAVGIGPIDGGQVALGADGRLHVVWFKLGRTDFLYTRTNDAGTGFERQFTLAGGEGVEAGPTVAADREGGVYVFWHTGEPPDAERAVWMTVSHDNGRTFEPARPISAAVEGACDCCGLRALTEEPGVVHVSYRGAGENVRRGQRLLTSRDAGATFEDVGIDDWRINACPISTTSLAAGPDGAAVAWENAGQVFLSPVDRLDKLEEALSPDGSAEWRRKNPAVAVNAHGETLLAWGDGPGWQSGGTFHWQLYDAAGRPTDDRGTGPEIPEGSVAAVVAEPDGGFLVLF
ncbi:MAG: sialidase family protein, partial [Acidobacteria bacterium]|nr:sialidase family protein [Acidobacteriota bacterium]